MVNSTKPTMKFIKYLIFLLLIAFIGMAIYTAVQPNDFEVSETITINAPKTVIYDVVSDSTETDWSSFWKATETLQQTSKTPIDSINQSFTSDHIKKSELKWTFTSNSDGSTTVTRILDAEALSFMTKAKLALFDDKEEDISDQFKSDLESLNQKVLANMAVYSIKVDGITDYGGGFYMYSTISSTSGNIRSSMEKQHSELVTFMNTHSILANGFPFTIYNEMDSETGNVIMSTSIPVSEKIIVAENSNILCGFMDRTLALKVTLQGNYTNLKEAWAVARKHLADNNLEASSINPFEIYRTDPKKVLNPAQWITEIYIPITDNRETL